jgi:hypothetical protein
VVLITPATLSKSASTHQKQPPAKIAVAVVGGAGEGACPAALATKASQSDKPIPRRRMRILPALARVRARPDIYGALNAVATIRLTFVRWQRERQQRMANAEPPVSGNIGSAAQSCSRVKNNESSGT